MVNFLKIYKSKNILNTGNQNKIVIYIFNRTAFVQLMQLNNTKKNKS